MKKKIIILLVIFSLMFLVSILQINKAEENNNPLLFSNPSISFGGGGSGINNGGYPKVNFTIPENNNPSLESVDNGLNVSDEGVKYDSSINEKFQNTTYLKVMVVIKDNSNLQFTGTKEERKIQLNQKADWFKPKLEEVLSNLSEDEFKLNVETGIGFNGEISQQGFEKLKNNSLIGRIDLDRTAQTLLDNSAPLINANDVWNLGYNGSGKIICLIDSGVNNSHLALKDKIIGEMCTCSVHEGGNSGCCNNGQTTDSGPNSALDKFGHGTEVAGILVSQNLTYRGIAYGSNLYVIKIVNSSGASAMSDIGAGIHLCVQYANPDIISISMGEVFPNGHGGNYPGNGPCPTYLDSYISEAYNAGIPVFVASGNDFYTNGINYPACSPHAISVGSSMNDNTNSIDPETDRIAGGSKPDILAPGKFITTTSKIGTWTSVFGTSFATPHAAAVAALMLQKNSSLSPDQILDILQKSTLVNISGYPRIDALAAFSYMDQTPSPTTNGTMSNCTESGYEQCGDWTYGDCRAKIAVNYYTSPNNIKWGFVNNSYNHYVIGNYSIGWKGTIAKQMYYNVNDPGTDGTKDCKYGGCSTGDNLTNTGTKVTVNAPGIANTKLILGYNDTTTNSCWIWFNGFNPNYGTNNPLYVLNCYYDPDCSPGYFCDKTGSWNAWSCIQKYSDGQSCSLNTTCQSGYCDNDTSGGLPDNNWCFTPYNTYFDGQDVNHSCEFATGMGGAECDERQIGDNLTGCSANKTYFADQCNSTCYGQDRTENICRSNSFASGCTADANCNGVVAGTGDCSLSCIYIPNLPPSNISSMYPSGGENLSGNSIIINWTASTDPNGNDFVRYFLEYSNNSGSNWYSLVSNYGYENKLNDSSVQKIISFNGNEDKTVYIKLPKKARVTNAKLTIGGKI